MRRDAIAVASRLAQANRLCDAKPANLTCSHPPPGGGPDCGGSSIAGAATAPIGHPTALFARRMHERSRANRAPSWQWSAQRGAGRPSRSRASLSPQVNAIYEALRWTWHDPDGYNLL